MRPAPGLLALAGLAVAAPAPDGEPAGVEALEPRAEAAWQYCSSSGMCYNSYATIGESTYRFALPETASGNDYEIAVQLVAPTGTGWIGISWGGTMTDAPITVAWPNGGTVAVSSRWATEHAMPGTYGGATYTVLGDTNVNSTHWTLSVICAGCSSWMASTGTKTINSGSTGVRIAWAQNTEAGSVSNPSDQNSNFEYHDYHGYISVDFSSAKVSSAMWNAARG